MKKMFILLICIPILSYSSIKSLEYNFVYSSPINNSKLHNKSTNIILRNKSILFLSDIKKELSIMVIGSKSGRHDCAISLSSNLKTLIINPDIDFRNGEKVTLTIQTRSSKKNIINLNFHISFKLEDSYENRTISKSIFLNPINLQSSNFTITVNNNPWKANLFFHSSTPPNGTVNILDTSGALIFSQDMSPKGMDWKVNLNNNLTYTDRMGGWFVMNNNYTEIDSVYCQNGYIADAHDFMQLMNGNYILIAYDEQPYAMDTIVAGGDPNADVEGFIIQELDANHNLIFQWRSWDYFHVTDNIHLNLTNSFLPFIHGNAIDIDFDGHFLISSKGLDEITKINRTTGNIIWRWGGSQNEFNFINDYPFTGQHCIRSLGNNYYILYDNGNYSNLYTNMPKRSRGVEYVLDTTMMTAEKVWEFTHPDTIFAGSTGSIQRLPNNNTLIDWGNIHKINNIPHTDGAIFTEVDSNNQIVFQLEFDNGYNSYRAHKFDWNFNHTTDIELLDNYNDKHLLRIFDITGRKTKEKRNTLLFYIYDDGTVEKKIIIE